jgi:hypothetical protein
MPLGGLRFEMKMKWIRRIVLGIVVLVLLVIVIVWVSLDSIVRSVVQNQATASLGVTTTLSSANLSIFGGKVNLTDLEVASPPSFTSPKIFTLDGIGVGVAYSQLSGSPIHISQIVIDHPTLVVEQSGLKLNLQALMDQMPQSPQTSSGTPAQPMKLIIDDLELNNAQVTFMPGIPGLNVSTPVTIPSLSLKNIGNADGNQNGAAIKEVVMQSMTALAASAGNAANLPPEVKALLAGSLGNLSQQLGANFNQQFRNVAGALTKDLPADTKNLINNNGKNALQQLFGGGKKDQ